MENKYDELLIQGLTKLMDLEFSYIPAVEDIDYTFSEKYTRNKEKLIKNLGHSYWRFVNTVAKKVAVIIVTLIITFSSLMAVDAFREKVVEFVYTIFTSFAQIISSSDIDPLSIERNYIPLNLPKSYIKSNFFLTESANSFSWVDDKNNMILLSQITVSSSNHFNSEHSVLYETVINDTPCLICKDTNLYYCYWEFDSYRFELIYPLDLGEEFMSEVVGNLVEIDPAELEN